MIIGQRRKLGKASEETFTHDECFKLRGLDGQHERESDSDVAQEEVEVLKMGEVKGTGE